MSGFSLPALLETVPRATPIFSSAFWYRKAIASWQKAAEQGDAEAQMNLAFAYEKGNGVDQDWIQAAFWYRMAAEQGKKRAARAFNEAYEKAALETNSVDKTVYLNLDNVMKLDAMLRKAGLEGLEEFSDLRSIYDDPKSSE